MGVPTPGHVCGLPVWSGNGPPWAAQMAQAAAAEEAAEEAMLRDLQLEELEDHGLIGSGSSGLVRRVRHTPTGRHLVLKVPPAYPPAPLLAHPPACLPRLTASLALVRPQGRRVVLLLPRRSAAGGAGLCNETRSLLNNCPGPATHRCNSSASGLGHISSCQTGRLVLLLPEHQKRTPESPLWNSCRLCTLSRRWGKRLGTRCLCIPHFPG